MQKKAALKASLKPLVLWVNQGSATSKSWSGTYARKTLPKALEFRWVHNLPEAVRWVGVEIYDADKILMDSFGQPLGTGKAIERNNLLEFSLDRSHFTNINSSALKVRISVYSANPWQSGGQRFSAKAKLLARSDPITLTFTEATIDEFSTSPSINTIKPGGKLFIKGALFGTRQGRVFLTFKQPSEQVKELKITKWEPEAVEGEIPGDIAGFINHDDSGFTLKTAFGLESSFQTVKSMATRHTIQLRFNDPVIELNCSNGAEHNLCNTVNAGTSEDCSGPGQLFKNPRSEGGAASITVFHQNCDVALDWDEGEDSFSIQLKNSWVFRKFEHFNEVSSRSETLDMLLADNLEGRIGDDQLDLVVRWKIGPGRNYVQYGYRIWITGPKGIPYR
ncbi:MAG: hypothetical protein MUP70_05275 [Candidatus Aminicenantes bacterium]|nr:hypothetical protein [Candidatus Aminicenantes bacterium]